jgi:hypothetical protein
MVFLIVGFFFIALSIGIANGISASPVMSVVIPLIFSLLTFGGGFYVFIKDLNTSAQKSIGTFFIAFSLGYISGLWGGAHLKMNSTMLIADENQPAYSEYEYTDVRLLSSFYKLDEMMLKSGLVKNKRKRILDDLFDSIIRRKESKEVITSSGLEIQKIWSESKADDLLELLNKIDYFVYELKNEETEKLETFVKLENQLQTLKTSSKIEQLSAIADLINNIVETQNRNTDLSPFLSEEEIEALKSIMETAKNKDINWFVNPVADGTGNIFNPTG